MAGRLLALAGALLVSAALVAPALAASGKSPSLSDMTTLVGVSSLGEAGARGSARSGGSSKSDNTKKSVRQLLTQSLNEMGCGKTLQLGMSGTSSKGATTIGVAIDAKRNLQYEVSHPAWKLQWRAIGSRLYMTASASYWVQQGELPATTAQTLEDRWVVTTISAEMLEGYKAMVRAFRPATLAGCLGQSFDSETIAATRKGAVTSVGGTRAIPLVDPGTRPGSQPSTAYVTATGRPRLLKISLDGPPRPGGTTTRSSGDSGACAAYTQSSPAGGSGTTGASGTAGASGGNFEADQMTFSTDPSFRIAVPAGALDLTGYATGRPKRL